MTLQRRRLIAALVLAQAIAATFVGIGLLDPFANLNPGHASLVRGIGIAAFIFVAVFAARALMLDHGVAGACKAIVTLELLTGCSSAIDALTATSHLNRIYLIAWFVAAVVVLVAMVPHAQRLTEEEIAGAQGAATEPPAGSATAIAVTAPELPLIRAGLRGFLELQHRDVLAVIGLVALALVIRVASPVFLPGLSHPFKGAPVQAWGLGYPFNPSECTDVPVPPGKQTAVEKTTQANMPLAQKTANYCGFVFDEIYFPVDAAKDLHQPAVSYFDPEPPLSKLLMTPPLQFWGFNPWTWRASTALFGSLLAGVLYLIALRLRRDRFFAFAAGLLVCIDGLALVESRTGVIDIIAIFWVALFYYIFLLHWQARTRTQWRATLYAMAAVCGLAFAAKLTALAPTVLVIGMVVARYAQPLISRFGGAVFAWLSALAPRRDAAGPQLWREAGGGKRAFGHYFLALLLVGAVFACSYSRYLTVPQTYYHFSSCDLKTTGLTGTTVTRNPPLGHVGKFTFVDPVRAVNTIVDTVEAGLQYHYQECHSHPYASHWLTWPVMFHPVLFYYSDSQVDINGVARIASVTDMGNPAIWWVGILALLFCIWRMLTGPWLWRCAVVSVGAISLISAMLLFHAAEKPDTVTVRVVTDWRFTLALGGMALFAVMTVICAVFAQRFVPAFIVVGYELAWMMWVPGNERRILFFYHALGMFVLMVLAIAYMLSAVRRIPWRFAGRTLTLAPVAYAYLALAVASFVFFYPVWTAQPLPASDHGMRIWVASGW